MEKAGFAKREPFIRLKVRIERGVQKFLEFIYFYFCHLDGNKRNLGYGNEYIFNFNVGIKILTFQIT
jgi:hypothetical protein